jgi:methyl-accepting chemotaxis protein
MGAPDSICQRESAAQFLWLRAGPDRVSAVPANDTRARGWRSLELRWLLTAAVGGPLFAVIAFQVLYFPSQQEAQFVAALQTKARNVAELIGHDIKTAIEFDDVQGVNQVFQGASSDTDLTYLVALKKDGSVFAALKPELAPKNLRADRTSGTVLVLDEASKRVLVQVPIEIAANNFATLHAGYSMERVQRDTAENRSQTLLIGGGVFLLGFALALWLGNFLGGQLKVVTGAIELLAAGDLTRQVPVVKAGAEVEAMSRSFNTMVRELRQVVSGLRGASIDLNDSAQKILSASREQEQGASEQSVSIEEISRSVAAVAETARGIAERGGHLMQIADDMLATMLSAQEAVGVARTGMNEIVGHQKLVVDRVNQLYEQSQSVISVVDIIDDISDRLDLLALNAALEGSRAGELGKGFSLVAQEMRRLAENVSGSTKHIKETIEEIQRLIQSSLDANQQGSSIVSRGATEMERMGTAIQRLFELIQRTTEAARQIGITTQQQLSSTEQTVRAVQEIGAISVQSARAAQDVTRTASELTGLSVNLRQTVAVFEVGGEGGTKPDVVN